ncbi:hypothetical protein [Bacteroides nordii]|uniref:hypothetical protein n=1 Tax=Bacteroides nordii TaxID=291645 RepID=UPI002A7F87CF|nr:hypothetical protein [Bacteroides nordii]
MIANLRNYEPDEIEFVVPDVIREKFPPVLFEGSTNVDEIIKLVNENFNATFPESELTQRILDTFEIEQIREEYCIKQESEVPKRERELLEAIERAKKIKSDAQDRLASIKTEIKDLAAEVKKGTREYHLSSKNTIRFALDGYFLYYSWVDGALKLVKGEKIPDWDKRSLWAQEDRNRKAMLDLFGIEYPEVDRPVDVNDEDTGDNFNDAFFDGEGDSEGDE